MSCQFTWNFNDYKTIEQKDEDVELLVATTPVILSGIENNTLSELSGNLVVNLVKTNMEDNDDVQENYNITYSTDNKVIGSLYVVTNYVQPNIDGFKTLLKNISGTISCKGIFSDFNNGTAIIEYDNDTGKRCLTLYEKSSTESSPMNEPQPLPEIAGDWLYEVSVLRRKNNAEIPNFNNIVKTEPTTVKITQNDRFVILEIPTDPTRTEEGYLLGTLTYVADHWKLTFSDYDDNGVFNLNKIEEGIWEGAYTEAGFLGSKEQSQTAGIVTLKKTS